MWAGVGTAALIGAAQRCASMGISSEMKPLQKNDTRWIFVRAPYLGTGKEPAKPLDTYQARKLTIEQIKQFVLDD